jgi:hypothetical protein
MQIESTASTTLIAFSEEKESHVRNDQEQFEDEQ